MNSSTSSAGAPSTPLPLADIALPETVSIWPLAPGYWALLAIVGLALIALAIYWRQRARNRYRHQLLKALDGAAARFYGATGDLAPNSPHPLGELAGATLLILKRAAKHLNASPAVLSASNANFLRWLEAQSPDSTSRLDATTRQLLCEGIYRPTPEGDAAALIQFAQHWLLKHRVSRRSQGSIDLTAPATETGAPR